MSIIHACIGCTICNKEELEKLNRRFSYNLCPDLCLRYTNKPEIVENQICFPVELMAKKAKGECVLLSACCTNYRACKLSSDSQPLFWVL